MRGTMVGRSWLLLLVLYSCGPITNGFHADLHKRATATIVWGDDFSAVGTATTWLRRQGLAVTERSLLASSLEMDNMDVAHTLKDEAAILPGAKWFTSSQTMCAIESAATSTQ